MEFDQITTLPNGIRVATEALPGPFSGVGVYLDAGSRYENEDLRGVSHIIDRLAFKVRSIWFLVYHLFEEILMGLRSQLPGERPMRCWNRWSH